MKILSIETSCDESALTILECSGTLEAPTFNILADSVASQIKIHAEYGGVFPQLAKREHGKALVPLLLETLTKASMCVGIDTPYTFDIHMLDREPELQSAFKELSYIQKPDIDCIAITTGPGLEPALWVGISFAKVLSIMWDIPVIPINHMEGHVVSGILPTELTNGVLSVKPVSFPAIALLISGGHTELIHIKAPLSYIKIGQTRDDAVGEAFDKVARTLGIPYPGGPAISKLAQNARDEGLTLEESFTRPMLHTNDYDFSFSGLKTKVLYFVRDLAELTDQYKKKIAREFEDAVTEVLVKKTMKALSDTGSHTLLVGGGVAANTHIKKILVSKCQEQDITVYFPRPDTATDNALMIGMSAYMRIIGGAVYVDPLTLTANGNWSITEV